MIVILCLELAAFDRIMQRHERERIMLFGFQSVLKIHFFLMRTKIDWVKQKALTVWNNFLMTIQPTDGASS